MTETVSLACKNASATIALRGAEPVRWQVGGRDLLWSGDPAHWAYSAPILFPRVGASRDGIVTVDGATFPMAQHGFARTSTFQLLERNEAACCLRLDASDETRAHYPFDFTLDVTATLAEDSLSLDITVTNSDDLDLPYALGFHPAFPWPLSGSGKEGHRVVFEKDERPETPEIAAGGLLARKTRPLPIEGRVLPLDPALFKEALVFLDARSRSFAFEAKDGAAVTMDLDDFPHLAVWSRPDAPFLSLEAWTGHADWADSEGELAERASMIVLPPGGSRAHAVRMRWSEPGA